MGDPITAQDVKFSLERFIDPKINVNYGFLAANVKGVEIIDSSTVKINMKSVDASILNSLTLMSASARSRATRAASASSAFR
jgi:peptide/nickel transport system substrate-binding protein